MPTVYDKERTLEREISGKVEQALPGVEVLAVELTGPERFTVYVDRPEGVDLALCEQVTRVLSDYLRDYGVDVSSPGRNGRCGSRSISSARSAGRSS
jgi:ribosome maturation factor RimP